MLVFDESTLRKLEQLSLVADQVRLGIMKGERRSRKRGTSIEFADYRNYVQGDDLRRLDWNIFARLDRPFLKLLEEEEDLSVHLLLDASVSMDWPDGDSDSNKLHYALRLAGALGYISLTSGDLLSISSLRSSGDLNWGPHRGRQQAIRLFEFLDSVSASGTTDLNNALKTYALHARRPGLLLLLSDLFSPPGFIDGLAALQARGYEVGIIHILSPDELDPPLGGDVRLLDVETGSSAEITLDTSTVASYRRRLQEWQATNAASCGRRGVQYFSVSTGLPWDRFVLQNLRVQGLLR